ncbi:MAG: hypothetical protein P1Q69_19160 [Candidatus Thorarchaeota archaeon]|nr:hypothetical protein [Candidatus Thorarchaeota archaeon]
MSGRMETVLKDRDVIAGRVDPAVIANRRIFLEITREDGEFRMAQTLAALAVMSKSGWKLESYWSTPQDMGFVFEKGS